MSHKPDISIMGLSTVGSITSLLLSEKHIKHVYHLNGLETSFLDLPPLSNPIVNGPTRRIEQPFIADHYLKHVPSIKNYSSISYDSAFQPYRKTSGQYKSETYSIDNRIRLNCFLDNLNNSPYIEVRRSTDIQEEIASSQSKINIIGGGEQLSSNFDDIEEFSNHLPERKRDLFFFNLKCNQNIYDQYSNEVRILYIADTAEILIYPFLHPNHRFTLNVTVNIIKGGQWDCFQNETNGDQAFEKFIKCIEDNFNELSSDFSNCDLADDFFRVIKTTPYFKVPVKRLGRNTLLGVGEAISKSDPLVGQGYNSGVKICQILVDEIEKYTQHGEIQHLCKAYDDSATTVLSHLYHLNKTSTQGTKNAALQKVYDLAAVDKPLRDYLFSTFDDISLYFPWLIDEEETEKMLERFVKI